MCKTFFRSPCSIKMNKSNDGRETCVYAKVTPTHNVWRGQSRGKNIDMISMK